MDTSALPFPKPEPLRRTRVRRRLRLREWKAQIRALVFARDPACRACGRSSARDEMHEIKPRSLTRGRPMQERFSRENCCRVCPACHEALTRHRLALVPVDQARGAEARLLPQPSLPIRHAGYRPAPTFPLPEGSNGGQLVHFPFSPARPRQRP